MNRTQPAPPANVKTNKPIHQPEMGREVCSKMVGSRGRFAPATGIMSDSPTSFEMDMATIFVVTITPGNVAAKPCSLRIASAALSKVRLVSQPPNA